MIDLEEELWIKIKLAPIRHRHWSEQSLFLGREWTDQQKIDLQITMYETISVIYLFCCKRWRATGKWDRETVKFPALECEKDSKVFDVVLCVDFNCEFNRCNRLLCWCSTLNIKRLVRITCYSPIIPVYSNSGWG